MSTPNRTSRRSDGSGMRSPSSASSGGSTASAAAGPQLLVTRLADGWRELRVERVKHAIAAASTTATLLNAGSSATAAPAPLASTLATRDNALLLPTSALHQCAAHAGQIMWARCTPPGMKPWYCLVRLWPTDKTAKASVRALLSSHASSPLIDGCPLQLRPVTQTIRAARALRLRPLDDDASVRQRSEEEEGSDTQRAITNMCKSMMVGRHVHVGMQVCVTLFEQEYVFDVTDIEHEAANAPLHAHPTPDQQLAQQLHSLSLDFSASTAASPSPAAPSSSSFSAPDGCPTLFLVSQSTRVLLDRSSPASAAASSASSSTDGFNAQPAAEIDASAIGGLDAELSALRELITLPLLQPQLFQHFDLRPPKGVLLYGPPGTGKTMLARTVAQQAFASFYCINGPEIISKYVGEAEEKLVSLFNTARANAPAIIFIDEIDSLCPRREDTTDEMQKRVVAAMLTLMDGLEGAADVSDDARATAADRVLVLGATNRPDAIDPALRRAGRFDREIEIGIPNEVKRRDILQRMLKPMPHDLSDYQLTQVASVTHGYVGADLKALCREAALVALERWQRQEAEWQTILSASIPSSPPASLRLTADDFRTALPSVKPSAMRSVVVDVPRVHWSDIGGQEEVKQKLKEAVEWPLMHPEAFLRLGIQPPKGVLLYGPPGCSKTLMAKALATESSRNFLAVKGPELFSKYVGESEKAIKEIFRKARAAAPSIIFFDEIDSIAAKRSEGGGEGGGERVSQRVLSQLLSEMDGIEPLRQVSIIAATNRPDLIDPALLRPGRIDRILYVSPPDEAACTAILRIEFRRIGDAVHGVDAARLAPRCVGLSGAEITALCREAAIVAMEQDLHAQQLTEEHFLLALQRVKPRITPQMIKFYDDYRAKSALVSV